MLYEFHRKQNSKKPNSVHATYLITGTKHSGQTNGTNSQEDEEDTVMQSSPPLPSSSFQRPEEDEPEVIPTRTIMIVKEENLEQAKAQFETITGIHIYSLQAKGLNDIHTLTECNRKVATDYASEDPLKEWKQYGIIQNPNVKRRERRNGPPPVAAAPAKKAEPVKAKVAPAPAPPALSRQASTNSNASTKATAEPTKAASKPTANRKDSSSIFKSFAKGAAASAAAKTKKAESQQSSNAPSPAAAEDVPMTGFSDDDDEGDSGLPEDPVVSEPSGPSKKDRKADLEAMMDMDDEPMEDAAPTPEPEQADEEEQHDEGAIDKPASKEEPKESVTVENGRRRGRRRVMKKKTVKDEEGYLGKWRCDTLHAYCADMVQSREKKLPGSPSLRTNLRPRRPKYQLQLLRRTRLSRRKVVNPGKAISCLSLAKSRAHIPCEHTGQLHNSVTDYYSLLHLRHILL